MDSKSEKRLDELYREHPDGFVAGRNELAKDLRDAGDRDEADRVKRLRRPTTAAWMINRAASESPAEVEEFAKASQALEKAQDRALEGKDADASKWRAAAERERQASRAVVDRAEGAARDSGQKVSLRTLELVVETLRAAAGDRDLRERVRLGRVEREQSAATLGTPVGRPPKAKSRSASAAAKRRDAAAKRRDAAQARRELKRLEQRLVDAAERETRLRAQVDQTTEALRHEKSKLADSKRQTVDLERQVKAAKRRVQN